MARELAYALKNPAPQAPFSNISDSQIVAIEQLSQIFSKEADNVKKRADPPQQQTMEKPAIVPQKAHPDWTKPLPSVHPNVIEDDEGKESKKIQHKVQMSPSGPIINPPEVPLPPPRLQTAKPPRVDKGGPISNLRSRGKKNIMPLYALTAKFQKTHEANAVTHKISGLAQE